MTTLDQDRDPPPLTADAPLEPAIDTAAAAGTVGDPVAEAVVPTGRTRGKRHAPLLRIRGELGVGWRIGLGAFGVALLLVAWHLAALVIAKESVLPTPGATWGSLVELQADGILLPALWASTLRILVGYAISVAIGIVIGLLIGSFRSVEAFFEPQVGFMRYIPASALTPLFLLWFGIGEVPKIWLIVVGTVFFNIVMMADVARAVPRELLDASYTLGAGRWTVLRRVIARHSIPGMIDVARVNLAAAWLMLVVAELLAAEEGLAYQIIRSQRFRAVDTMFALLIVFGVIGLVSDLALRGLRNVAAPWNRP
jgi:NitT/TauT family transport system permease protein